MNLQSPPLFIYLCYMTILAFQSFKRNFWLYWFFI